MGDCCSPNSHATQKRQIIWIVLWLNVVMFAVQISAAVIGHSSSLLADSIDMLGDAITYAASLIAIGKSDKWLIGVSKLKAWIITGFACIILIEITYKLIVPIMPSSHIMLWFSLLALIVNFICLWLLTRHKNADINMRSTWICARNDVIGNALVIFAAGLVWWLNSRWPDIILAAIFAIYLLYSAQQIFREIKQRP